MAVEFFGRHVKMAKKAKKAKFERCGLEVTSLFFAYRLYSLGVKK